MNKLTHVILFLFIVLVVACSQGTHQRQLVQVDSLLDCRQSDSAYHALKQIDRYKLSNERERMHYDLLQLMISQGMSPDSFDFDTSRDMVAQRLIDYNRRTGNKRDLLLCHLYYGKILLLDHHNYNDASVYLKKAEELLPQVNDIRLNYLTNEALATLNYYSGNEELALEYSYKTLTCVKQGDELELSHAYNHLVVLYMARKEPDSVSKYCSRVISILDRMTPKNRSIALCNLGSVHLNNYQLDSADIYFQRAYDEYPLNFINQRRAIIYSRLGDPQKADSLWQLALQSPKLLDRVETYFYMLNEEYAHQDYEGASLAAMRLLELKDSLSGQEKTVEVLKTQKKYDKEVARRKLHQTVIRFLLGGLAMIAVLTVLIIVHSRKSHRNKELILRNEALIGDYQRQIKQLEQSGEEAIGRINELRQKIVSLQTERAKKISEGEELYHRILNGEPIESWSKDEIQNFIDYYKLVNLSFMLEIERDYTNLSPGNRLFLILEHMGKTNDELSHILGVTSTTLRSTRLRLRKKHNPIS